MSRDWEAAFSSWGAAPGTTSQTKSENAERAVRKAIAASTRLSQKNIEVFVQGSYANRTNVREDSDVDVCVLYTDAFFSEYPPGLSREALGFAAGGYLYAEFKNDVEAALISYFDTNSVTRGNKAFDIHANTYRIDADVVPCFEHRRYTGTIGNHRYVDPPGTELHPDAGERVINWPRQNYSNGVWKNDNTGRRFKAVTRILKRLKNEMLANGQAAAKPIPSYLLECLAWNVPDGDLQQETLRRTMRHVLAHLWNETRTDEKCGEWGEVNELKYLFRSSQPWTRTQVNTFLQAAWDYIGFE
jgi:predicted nucleotidyltransferase